MSGTALTDDGFIAVGTITNTSVDEIDVWYTPSGQARSRHRTTIRLRLDDGEQLELTIRGARPEYLTGQRFQIALTPELENNDQ